MNSFYKQGLIVLTKILVQNITTPKHTLPTASPYLEIPAVAEVIIPKRPSKYRFSRGVEVSRPRAAQQETTKASTAVTAMESKLDMPTTEETVDELKRRLGKELYRIELDLQSGARIAGKPCDCLSESKHTGAVTAATEELMSYEKNPAYGKIVDWFNSHAPKFKPSVIAKTEPDYYRGLTPEVRAFRKEVMGTEKVGAIFSGEEKELIKNKAAEKIGKELE